MSLLAGSKLIHYEILGPLGAGAMGEVYRARDTKLGREVAIKVLPEHFADEPERLKRFEREATTLASLNHPNVAQIFGVDQVGDICFLVLELVPGESLDERLKRGPLPLDEALDVCKQIAEGLEAAHEAGVIHRDLKPANVRLTPDGKVKVLDFGLAKPANEGNKGSSTDSVLSTEAGRLLGTPTYMAPEQARGKSIDKRVDIWAFGCVLFECLTAKRAFAGETLTDVLGAVLHTEPDFARLPANTPTRVRELLADCLIKDPRARARDCGELARQIARAHREPAPAAPSGTGRLRERVAWATALLATFAALLLAFRRTPEAPPAPIVRSSLILPGDFHIANSDRPLCISPDGRRLAVIGSRADQARLVWIRALDSKELQPLSGTESADYAFWSPDGSEIAFFADGKLKRIPATGGSVTTICASESSRGGSWGSLGDIVFASSAFGPLYRVPASGGTPTPVTSTTGKESHRLPQFLPDGRRLLYTRTNSDDQGIHVLDLGSGKSTRIAEDVSDALYARGLLLFVRQQNLMAQPFDADELVLSGEPRLVVENVEFRTFRATGPYCVSANGDVAFASSSDPAQLQWFDAEGNPGDRIGSPARYVELGLSPDGKRIAAVVGREGNERDLWILDAQRGLGTKLSEAVSLGAGRVFFPDAGTIVYARSGRESFSEFEAVLRSLDGSAAERRIPGGWAQDISRDGTWMLYSQQVPGTQFDILCRRVDGGGEPLRLATSTANELNALFSPDGKWIAFGSDATGRPELNLMPFPGPGASQQLTASGIGGRGALAWLDDGRLTYRDATDARKLWALSVDTRDAAPVIGTPVPIFGGRPIADGPTVIRADGTRLLVAVPCDESERRSVNLIQSALSTARGDVR
ncbi:MAG: protein kinase domain-containing protein [Planctomycetota bacterium]